MRSNRITFSNGAAYQLNWRRQPKDVRDHNAAHFFRGCAPIVRPARVDMRDRCSPVENQLDIGACTGNALVGAVECLALRDGYMHDYSRLMAYYNARSFWNKLIDSGAFIRDVVKGAVRYGVCRETTWPYDVAKFAMRPPVSAYIEGERYQITEYANLGATDEQATLDNLRDCLARGLPFVFGFDCYDNFLTPECAKNGIVKVPAAGEVIQGGHAVLAVGYDDDSQCFIVRNSWGEGWGQKGYFMLPYWYVLSGHASDFWVVQAQESGKPNMVGAAVGVWRWASACLARRPRRTAAAVLLLAAGLLLSSGCVINSTRGAGWTMFHAQLLEWQRIPEIEATTNRIHVVGYESDTSSNAAPVVQAVVMGIVEGLVKSGAFASRKPDFTDGVPFCSPPRLAPPTNGIAPRILVVGDSWGSAVVAETQRDEGWPEMMELPVGMIQARDGSTACEWASDKDGMLSKALATPCDRVIVSLGGNEMFRAYDDRNITPEEIGSASASLRKVVSDFQNKVGRDNVYVVLYANPYPARIDATAAALALRAGIVFACPAGTKFLDMQNVLNSPECWSNGDFHPSFEGNVREANYVKEMVQ